MARIEALRGNTGMARDDLAIAADSTSPGSLAPVLALYEELTAAQPDDAWLHNGHANTLQRAGQPEEALAAYNRALTLDSENPSLHFNRGQLLFRAFYQAIALTGLGRADEAIALLQDAGSQRTASGTMLDNGDRLLLGRFAEPPMPGLDTLLSHLEPQPEDRPADDGSGS